MIDTLEVLREARRVAEVKDWTRSALMRPTEEALKRLGINMGPELVSAGIYSRSEGLLCVFTAGPIKERVIECDEVGSCCSIGFVEYAIQCMTAVGVNPEWRESEEVSIRVQHALKLALWERPEVRREAAAFITERVEEEDPEDVGDVDLEGIESFEMEKLDGLLSRFNAGEGLLPWWNDHMAKSREDVQALLDSAISREETR